MSTTTPSQRKCSVGSNSINGTNQTTMGSVSEDVAALQKITADCNFGTVTATTTTPSLATATTAMLVSNASSPQKTRQVPQAPAREFSAVLPLEVMMRDRLICGIKDSHLQRLLVERNITLDCANTLALKTESAASQQFQMRKQGNVPSSTATTSKGARSSKKSCILCAGMRSPDKCKLAKDACKFFHKGHLEERVSSKEFNEKSKECSSSRTRRLTVKARRMETSAMSSVGEGDPSWIIVTLLVDG